MKSRESNSKKSLRNLNLFCWFRSRPSMNTEARHWSAILKRVIVSLPSVFFSSCSSGKFFDDATPIYAPILRVWVCLPILFQGKFVSPVILLHVPHYDIARWKNAYWKIFHRHIKTSHENCSVRLGCRLVCKIGLVLLVLVTGSSDLSVIPKTLHANLVQMIPDSRSRLSFAHPGKLRLLLPKFLSSLFQTRYWWVVEFHQMPGVFRQFSRNFRIGNNCNISLEELLGPDLFQDILEVSLAPEMTLDWFWAFLMVLQELRLLIPLEDNCWKQLLVTLFLAIFLAISKKFQLRLTKRLL